MVLSGVWSKTLPVGLEYLFFCCFSSFFINTFGGGGGGGKLNFMQK